MIDLRHVQKSFGEKVILSDFSYHFEAGRIYALIGKSGSGKTTLLNILAKLESNDGGEILYQGKPLKSIKEQAFFEKELGYLFQNLGLLESESIEANLMLGLIGKKRSRAEKSALMHEALEAVGLSHLKMNRKMYTLSGGEAQRVAIAKIMLKQPPLVLADEPTASLDPQTAEDILELIFRLRAANRVIILATHSPGIWERCDEIIRLSH